MKPSRRPLGAWWAAFLAMLLLGSAGMAASAPPSASSATSPDASPAGPCRDLTAGDHVASIEVDGMARAVLIHVPGMSPGLRVPMPLVIAFHWRSAHASDLAAASRLSTFADRDGFVVAYPQALGLPTEWLYPGDPRLPSGEPGDVAFAEALLDLAAATGCIDPSRVYLIGHSMGGGMADALACQLADRIAGAVLVAAVQLGASCAPSRPVPIVVVHAVDDPIVPYAGGPIRGMPAGYPDQLPVEQAAAEWAARDGCIERSVTTPMSGGGVVLTWQGCDAPVVLYRQLRGAHAFPVLGTRLLRRMIHAAVPEDAESTRSAEPPS